MRLLVVGHWRCCATQANSLGGDDDFDDLGSKPTAPVPRVDRAHSTETTPIPVTPVPVPTVDLPESAVIV